jgi:hypothetical protein
MVMSCENCLQQICIHLYQVQEYSEIDFLAMIDSNVVETEKCHQIFVHVKHSILFKEEYETKTSKFIY